MITGIVVALPQELDTLTKRKIVKGGFVTLNESIILAYSGAGADNAQTAAALLIKQSATRLISWGCAAALSPNLQSGNLVLADALITAEGDTLAIDSTWHKHVKTGLERLASTGSNKFALRTGTLLESKTLVAKSTDKQQLYQQSKAVALDMESVAVAKVAQQHNLSFLAIRAIADPVTMDLPEAVRVALNSQGDIDMGKLVRFFLTHPSEIKGLCALNQQFNAAKNTLKSVGNVLSTIL